MQQRIATRPEDYTIGWICAISTEYVVACELLDHEYSKDAAPRIDTSRDRNSYTFGRIHEHNVVIACLPKGRFGTNSAAIASERMRISFPSIQFGLMVGIAGGAPSARHDIRLGDVVVSSPNQSYGGVLQYDHGKTVQCHEFQETGALPPPPDLVLNAMAHLMTIHRRKGHQIQQTIQRMLTKNARLVGEYDQPDPLTDQLHHATYIHDSQNICHCQKPIQHQVMDSSVVVARPQRDPRSDNPVIHYGLIASANTVMKDAMVRDTLVAKHDVLCFEMEAAGLMNTFPCVVIRGICDYSDTHKNDAWQGYAAATATAYAKELLEIIPGAEVTHMGSGLASGAVNSPARQNNTISHSLSPNFSGPTTSELDLSFSHLSDSSIMPNRSLYVIPPRNLQFVGRQGNLQLLEERLFADTDCQQCAVVGLGGVGKTQLALAFCHNIKQRYPEYSIFWLSGLSLARFQQDCAVIAKKCSIITSEKDDMLSLVKEHLSSEVSGKWLLVVDNIDDKSLLFDTESAIADRLPQSENGKLLYTTRYKDIAVDIAGSSNVLNLEVMTIEESELFLSKSLRRKELVQDTTVVRDLLAELEYLPLAIAQASSYITKTSISLSNYLSLMRNSETDMITLLSQDFRDNTRDKEARSAVAVTWLVSFQQMRKEEPEAAELLYFIALIENKKIPMYILPQPTQGNLLHAIGTLMGYSFLTQQGDVEEYDMHRLVHRTARLWMRKEGIIAEWSQRAVLHLAEIFPWDEWRYKSVWRDIVPHTIRLLEDTRHMPSQHRADISLRLGCCLGIDGRFIEAFGWIAECASWRDQHLPRDDQARLDSQHELAIAYKDIGQAKKAIELLEDTIATELGKLSPNPFKRLASQHVLAMAYFDDDQRERAIQLLQETIKEKSMRLTRNNSSTLASKHELARAYSRVGETGEAIKILEQIVEAKTSQLARNDPSRLVSQHELATAYRTCGHTQKAIDLLEQVVEVQAIELDPTDARRLLSEHELAGAYLNNGQTKQAIELLQQLVDVQVAAFGANDINSLVAQHELGRAYRRDNQTENAIRVLKRVVRIKSSLAPHHPSRLVSQQVLARAYEDDGQLDKAVELMSRVVAVCQAAFGPNQSDRLLYEYDLDRMTTRLQRKRQRRTLDNSSSNVIVITDSD